MKKKLCAIMVSLTLVSLSLLTSFYFFGNNKDNDQAVNSFIHVAPKIYLEKTIGKFPFTIQPKTEQEYPDDLQYTWDFGDNTRSNLPCPSHVYDEPGIYTVALTLEDNLGNRGSDSVQISVQDNIPPIVSISAEIGRKRAPLKINFHADASDADGKIVSYEWDFDDMKIFGNQTSTEQSPTHSYWTSGAYFVKCTVTDDDGGTATSMIKIDVKLNEIRAINIAIRLTQYSFNKISEIISFINNVVI